MNKIDDKRFKQLSKNLSYFLAIKDNNLNQFLQI